MATSKNTKRGTTKRRDRYYGQSRKRDRYYGGKKSPGSTSNDKTKRRSRRR